MNCHAADLRPALFAILRRRIISQHPRFRPRLLAQRAVALLMVALLLPLAQIDALAQQPWSQQGNPYDGQYQQADPGYSQQPSYAPQPIYRQQPDYGGQLYARQPYPQQPAAPQKYAGQGDSPGQYGSPQPPSFDQQSGEGFGSQQLEQLTAPIALYPDALVAQILAAATYPAQVAAADQWLRSMGRVSPDQVAAVADAQGSWDPSVKALTAFPQVLATMDRNLEWTTDLGNAYYNQPQDVLATIQVLRQRAENAGTLRSTPQEQVSEDQGYVELAPQNPAVVYVPAYNPWYTYGAPISPYPGFYAVDAVGHVLAGIGAGLVFGVGIAVGAFFHAAFGWLGWGLNWHSGSVFYHNQPYYSRSASIAHWGSFGGNRGVRGYAGAGAVRPARAMPEARTPGAGYRSQQAYGRSAGGYAGQPARRESEGRMDRAPGMEGGARAQGFQGNPAGGNGYGRPSEAMRQPVFPAQQGIGRAPAYAGAGYYSGGYRSEQPFSNQRAYMEPGAASRGFAEQGQRYESSSGGYRSFVNHGGESYRGSKAPSFHAPKAPKMPGGHSGGGIFHHSGGGKHH